MIAIDVRLKFRISHGFFFFDVDEFASSDTMLRLYDIGRMVYFKSHMVGEWSIFSTRSYWWKKIGFGGGWSKVLIDGASVKEGLERRTKKGDLTMV